MRTTMAARLMGRSTGRVVRRKIRNMTARYRDRTDAKHAGNAMPPTRGGTRTGRFRRRWRGYRRAVTTPKGAPVSGEMDQMKGRVKQAAGDLGDDDDLKREGKLDETAGKLKEKVGDAKDKVEDAIDDTKNKADR